MKNVFSTDSIREFCMLIAHASKAFLHNRTWLLVVVYSISGIELKAQDVFVQDKEAPVVVYDDLPVSVKIEGYQSFNLNVIYTSNKQLYIDIESLFKALKIPCVARCHGDSLSGFIENENHTYVINYAKGQIESGSAIFNSSNGLIKEWGVLYMEAGLLEKVFGIILKFNFRSLSIVLSSTFELPIMKQMRVEKMRNNLSKLRSEEIPDTVVKRRYHLFKPGMLDWAIATSQTNKGAYDNYLGLRVGTEFLFGEADVSVDFFNRHKFDNRQLQFIWRWVDNDKSIIKQAQVGKISHQAISSIHYPIIGASVRNSPTTIRKAKGYHSINEFTEPNWTVELYINNILVDYIQADASGFFMFKVPVIYGFTTLKLKFYGPLGEERSDERIINMPYTIMPTNEFEYGLSAGVLQDSSRSRFGRGEFSYGLSSRVTISGGLEYLSSLSGGPFIPFAKATFQPFSKLTINAEYAYGVKTRGMLNYYIGKNTLLEIEYSKYVEGQQAVSFGAPEERKIKLSVPFRKMGITGFAKFNFTQLVYKEFNYNQGSLMLSFYYRQINANTSTQFNWINKQTPYLTTDLTISYKLRKGFTFRPAIRYNLSQKELMSYKAEIEKRIPKGFLSVSYEKYLAYHDHYINVNLRYDLPFSRNSVSASQSRGKMYLSESAQGSLAFGSGNRVIHGSNSPAVSKGGISVYPFLDLNQNGIFDANEHMVKVSNVRISGGKAIFNDHDSIIRIPDLNSFTSYEMALSDNDLENIAWRFRKKLYQVLVDPNQFKRVDVPVIAMGEVSGNAFLEKNHARKGIGRIKVNIYKKDTGQLMAEILTETDGYLYFLGLAPGEYEACVDTAQLNNLGLSAAPSCIGFVIKSVSNGDAVSGINFILK